MQLWLAIVLMIVTLLIGLVVGFFVSRKVFTNQLRKNPPLSEKNIRLIMQQMGRTPSEKQVRAIMRKIEEQ